MTILIGTIAAIGAVYFYSLIIAGSNYNAETRRIEKELNDQEFRGY